MYVYIASTKCIFQFVSTNLSLERTWTVVFVRDNVKCRICSWKTCAKGALFWLCREGEGGGGSFWEGTATPRHPPIQWPLCLALCWATFYPPMLLPVMAHIRPLGLERPANHGPIRFEYTGWGANPPIRGHRGGLTDRQAKGWCFGAGVSSLFVQTHLRDTDTGVRLDTNTTMQDFRHHKIVYFYQSFLFFSLCWIRFVVPGPNHELL